MESSFNTIERKVVDTLGHIGSLYDASRDLLLNSNNVKKFEKTELDPHSKCHIYSGSASDGVINLMKAIKFDDSLLQSILLGMIEPSGISSFINYKQPVNENTCFLYYSYKHRQEQLYVIAGQTDKIVPLPSDLNNATHMITEIVWGFEVLCVIQSPNHQSANSIEELLYNISQQLQNCDEALKLSKEEERQLQELPDVTIFGSKAYDDNSNSSLFTVLTSLRSWQRHTTYHHPILYKLHSLKWLYKKQSFPELYRLSEQDNAYIVQLEPIIAHLIYCFNNITQVVQNRRNDLPERFGILPSLYEDFRMKLQNILVDVRRGKCKSIEINNIISDEKYSSLRKPAIDQFYDEVQQWLGKRKLMERFQKDKIIYSNIHDVFHHEGVLLSLSDIDGIVKDHFAKKYTSAILWYSSDRLKREKTDKWEQLYQQLTSERQQTSLIYADFTGCYQNLEDFIVIRLPASESQQNHSKVHSSPSSRTEINVLLLGESGVGKSTFINAFVNYLIFDTLQQAEQSEPVVLIPVSFLTTVGDQFDEVTVKFGDVDPNEDHEHQGQSVTQQCKSYVFHLNEKFTLRLIDSPGIGDTRGIAQDDKNIEHTLTYVNNLSHLNAVCLLLKPNASQLNIFFRSCISQLFTYLTPIGYNNIIFCFTNARSTFFAPGDTGSLLRQLLKNEHQNDIPFQKTNTFCFDSESFRYLAARKCNVNFDDFQKQECTNSWTTSVTESVRLLQYILAREPYYLNEYQTPRKFALEISTLAQPLMETLRLIIYNSKLRETGTITNQMILNSTFLTSAICFNCAKKSFVQRGPFWIVEYEPTLDDTVQHCQCSSDEKHFLIECIIKHEFISQLVDATVEGLQTRYRKFLYKCDRITRFLQQSKVLNQDDPFQPIIERFLEEERQISDKVNGNLNINKQLKETLRSIRQTRQQNQQKLTQSNEKLSLKDVYIIINKLTSISDVQNQINSIQKSRQLQMEANEHQIKLPPNKNARFSEIINSLH